MATTEGRKKISNWVVSNAPNNVAYIARFTTLADARRDTARNPSAAATKGKKIDSDVGQNALM